MIDYSHFLKKRKDRALATILSFKDAECDPYLPGDVSSDLREVILDEVNDLFSTFCDVLTGEVNDIYVEKLDLILRALED